MKSENLKWLDLLDASSFILYHMVISILDYFFEFREHVEDQTCRDQYYLVNLMSTNDP